MEIRWYNVIRVFFVWITLECNLTQSPQEVHQIDWRLVTFIQLLSVLVVGLRIQCF